MKVSKKSKRDYEFYLNRNFEIPCKSKTPIYIEEWTDTPLECYYATESWLKHNWCNNIEEYIHVVTKKYFFMLQINERAQEQLFLPIEGIIQLYERGAPFWSILHYGKLIGRYKEWYDKDVLDFINIHRWQ